MSEKTHPIFDRIVRKEEEKGMNKIAIVKALKTVDAEAGDKKLTCDQMESRFIELIGFPKGTNAYHVLAAHILFKEFEVEANEETKKETTE